MVSKLFVVFAIFAITFVVNAVEEEHHEEEDHGPVEYEFSYAVHDDKTKDIKSHKEHRKDDVVVGSYELIDSDGFKRRVEYKSDKHNGFTAIVHREPTHIKVPIPVIHYEVEEPKVEESEKKVKKAVLSHHYYAGNNHVSYHSPRFVYHY